MMHKCLYDSLTDHAKTTLIPEGDPQDGPTLFYQVVTVTFTATFIHAQATQHAYQTLSPKRFQYDITKVNSYTRVAFKAIRSASQNGQEVLIKKLYFIIVSIFCIQKDKVTKGLAFLYHVLRELSWVHP
jgi:hypothetical protein